MIAAELYTCAMNFEPSAEDLAILLANRSLCLLHSGRGKDALSDATRCTMLRPLWPKGYYRLGAALMFLEDYEEASRAFADGLELDPANALRKEEKLENATQMGWNRVCTQLLLHVLAYPVPHHCRVRQRLPAPSMFLPPTMTSVPKSTSK